MSSSNDQPQQGGNMTTIPFPDQWRPMHIDVKRTLSIQLDDCWVNYTYNTATITFSISDRSLDWSDTQVREVLQVDLDEDGKVCGETPFDYLAASDIPQLMQAIPHFYAASGDRATDERKSIRGVYHRLAKLAVPA